MSTSIEVQTIADRPGKAVSLRIWDGLSIRTPRGLLLIQAPFYLLIDDIQVCERLFEIVDGAQTQRLNGRFGRRVGRHHDAATMGLKLTCSLDDLNSAHAG